MRNNCVDDFEFIWSDNWCIADDKAWFVTGEQDILFCLDRKTKNTILAKEIPERNNSFRLHPKCIKYGEMIFCLPDMGENIWCYNIVADMWAKIKVNNPQRVRIACTNAWVVQGKLYVVSIGLKQILELNLQKEIIYYSLPIRDEGKVSGSILIDQQIYLVGVYPAVIYKFNCLTKKIDIIRLPDIRDSIHTIVYDGKKFWMTGYRRRIYVWEEKINNILILDKLPDEFGIWNFSGRYDYLLNFNVDSVQMPLFLYSIYNDQHIWLIPAQSNEIIYINKVSYEIKIFHLENEDQSEENVKKQLLGHKYLLEYILSERYIGLFSLKNRWIIEIDTKELKYKIIPCHVKLEHKCLIRKSILSDMFRLGNPMNEKITMRVEKLIEYVQLKTLDSNSFDKDEIEDVSIGESIYKNLNFFMC